MPPYSGTSRHVLPLCLQRSEINIYVSRPNWADSVQFLDVSRDIDLKGETKGESVDLMSLLRTTYPTINFFEETPESESLVKQSILKACNSVAFLCSGAPVIVDDLRFYVRVHIDETNKRFDFYTLEVWT